MQTKEKLPRQDGILGGLHLALEEIRMVSPVSAPDARILTWCCERLERLFSWPLSFDGDQAVPSADRPGYAAADWAPDGSSRRDPA